MSRYETYGESSDGLRVSPGGFEFGVQGWRWGDAVPTAITFFLDGTVCVTDQYGRPIRGTTIDGKDYFFAARPPSAPEGDYTQYPVRYYSETDKIKKPFATHAEVVAGLAADRIDWQRLACAGWPQLPYADLKKLPKLPPTPVEELRKIRDPQLRKDALRARREADEALTKELVGTDD